VRAAGITVIIAKFQWVGVMASTNLTEPASQSAADVDDGDNESSSSLRMHYFIKVVLCLMSLLG